MNIQRLTFVFILCASLAAAADWPQWRGPDRNGISAETGLLQQWPESGPKLLWRLDDVGDGYGTVAVVGDHFYIVGNRGMGEEFVAARLVNDGTLIWSLPLGKVGAPDQRPSYPKARSTPTVEGGVLYAFSSDGDLAAVQTATGEKLWGGNVRADFGGQPGNWAYAESPLVDDDKVIVTPGGAEATLIAINKADGEVVWRAAVPGGDVAAYTSPITTMAAGRKQYVQFLDKGVVGVDAKNGDFLWRYAKTSSGPANISDPVAHDGYVYSTNARRFGAGLVRLSQSSGGVSAEEVYFERYAPNTLGGQVLLDGVLYGTNQEGLVAADFMTGKVSRQSEGGPGAVIYADGRIYVRWESGEVSLVEATNTEFLVKGRFTPPNPPEHLLGPREVSWSYPVVANGRLYIRDMGTLWCYDVSR